MNKKIHQRLQTFFFCKNETSAKKSSAFSTPFPNPHTHLPPLGRQSKAFLFPFPSFTPLKKVIPRLIFMPTPPAFHITSFSDPH